MEIVKKTSFPGNKNKKIVSWMLSSDGTRRGRNEIWYFVPIEKFADTLPAIDIMLFKSADRASAFTALTRLMITASESFQTRESNNVAREEDSKGNSYRYYGVTATVPQFLKSNEDSVDEMLQSPDEDKSTLHEALKLLGPRNSNLVSLRLKQGAKKFGIPVDVVWIFGLPDNRNIFHKFKEEMSRPEDRMDALYFIVPFQSGANTLVDLPCPIIVFNAPNKFVAASNLGMSADDVHDLSCQLDIDDHPCMKINLGHPTMDIGDVARVVARCCRKRKYTNFSKKVVPVLKQLQLLFRGQSDIGASAKTFHFPLHNGTTSFQVAVVWVPSDVAAPFAWSKVPKEVVIESITLFCKKEDLAQVFAHTIVHLSKNEDIMMHNFKKDGGRLLRDCFVKLAEFMFEPTGSEKKEDTEVHVVHDEVKQPAPTVLGHCSKCEKPVTAQQAERLSLSCGKHTLYYHKACWRSASVAVNGQMVCGNDLKFKFTDASGKPFCCFVNDCSRPLEEVVGPRGHVCLSL